MFHPLTPFWPVFLGRFFRSLVRPRQPEEPAGEDASLQIVAADDHSEREPEPDVGRPDVATLDFSMESILEFQNHHLVHKTVADPPANPIRKRPNYDNRKRKFLAASAPERRRLLV